MSNNGMESPKYKNLEDIIIEDPKLVTYVVTRTGKKELLDTNQIVRRFQTLIRRPKKIEHINPYDLMTEVVKMGIISGMSTSEIDEIACDKAASNGINNPHYLKLAARIAIDSIQKNTARSFLDKMKKAYLRVDDNGNISPMLSPVFFKYVERHQDAIENMIDYNRDFLFDYFGFKTYQMLYGFAINGVTFERPQDFYMRTAVSIHLESCDMSDEGLELELKRIKTTYDALSNRLYTHGSPTYFNAGTNNTQYSSCFLLGTEDSINGLKDPGKNIAVISKWGGGIGMHMHSIRGRGALIRSTNGRSNGIVPFIKEYGSTMVAWNQGGKRLGSAAIYLMPHHPDIEEFLVLKMKQGIEEERVRNLFYAVWMPDLYLERFKTQQPWSLFDPDKCGDLSNYYDSKTELNYTNRYLQLEKEGKFTKQIEYDKVLQMIYTSKLDNGIPYICMSDTINRCNMQNNIGVIKSSNLCAEIVQFSNIYETATCNLASVSLPACIVDTYNNEEMNLPEDKRRVLDHEFPLNPHFDFNKLIEAVRIATMNLNNIIDKNFYPTIESKRSNMRHRPIGIGLQGLADAYLKMRYPFDSEEARILNKKIAETMYYAALSESTSLARADYQNLVKKCKTHGSVKVNIYTPLNYNDNIVEYTNASDIPKTIGAYPSMLWNGGGHISKGTFHWELAGLPSTELSGMYDWETLREHIKIYGVKNSLLIALMPTASTSQLLSNNECFEPYTSNLYKRKTLTGDNTVINKWLVYDLYRLNLWNEKMKDYVLACNGSIQFIDGIPDEIKRLYKTAFELAPEELIQQAIDRQPFVDQAQSLNWYVTDLSYKKFLSLVYKAWRGGLKTIVYYLHSKAAMSCQKFTIDPELQKEMAEKLEKEKSLRSTTTYEKDNEPMCILCGS